MTDDPTTPSDDSETSATSGPTGQSREAPASGPAAQADAPPAETPPGLPAEPKLRDWFEALLRHPVGLATGDAATGGRAMRGFALIAGVSLLVFGFVLGTFAYHDQLWAAPLKLAVGAFFAALICYPSLYIFASLAGSRISAMRLAVLLTGMLALTGVLLLGFAPAVWIFTQGTNSFGFMGFLALASWLIALAFGFRFMITALRAQGAAQTAPLATWCAIFLLVTLQLTTSLRPILGRSEQFLTHEKKFFLQHWGSMMSETLDVDNGNDDSSSGTRSR